MTNDLAFELGRALFGPRFGEDEGDGDRLTVIMRAVEKAQLTAKARERNRCIAIAEGVAEECCQHAGSLYATAGNARATEIVEKIRSGRNVAPYPSPPLYLAAEPGDRIDLLAKTAVEWRYAGLVFNGAAVEIGQEDTPEEVERRYWRSQPAAKELNPHA